MDFALLLCAKYAARNPAGYRRLAVGAAFGAAFALIFPLIRLPVWAAVAVKIAAGLALGAAGKFRTIKGYLKFTLMLFAMTALTGGALIAVFSVTGAEYALGAGYMLTNVPIGIPLLSVTALAIGVAKLINKRKQAPPGEVVCTLYKGENKVRVKGFYDSGNKVYYGGAPVTIIPRKAAEKLTDCGRIKTYTQVHTVAGPSRVAVFTADRIEIESGAERITRHKVVVGASPQEIKVAVLHPDVAAQN